MGELKLGGPSSKMKRDVLAALKLSAERRTLDSDLAHSYESDGDNNYFSAPAGGPSVTSGANDGDLFSGNVGTLGADAVNSVAHKQWRFLRTDELGDDEPTFDLLSPDQRSAFLRAVADGSLSSELSCWNPWWTEPFSLNPLITSAAEDGAPDSELTLCHDTEHRVSAAALRAARDVMTLPPPRTGAAAPSPLLRFSLVNVLYAYAHCSRLYVGEWTSDIEGAVSVFLGVATVLSLDARFESMDAVIAGSISAALVPAFRLSDSPDHARALAISVLKDVSALLGGGADTVLTALVDARLLTDAAGRAARISRVSGHASLAAASKKLQFIASWTKGWIASSSVQELRGLRDALESCFNSHVSLLPTDGPAARPALSIT